jgi:hypothetical protein
VEGADSSLTKRWRKRHIRLVRSHRLSSVESKDTPDLCHGRMGFCGEMWPFFRPNFLNLEGYLASHRELGYTDIRGYIPTGWAISSNYNKRNACREKGPVAVQLVPYSEHSNFQVRHVISFMRGVTWKCGCR